jgi:tRNA(Ile)-lysidine synthase
MNLERIFAEFLEKEKLSDKKLLLLVSGGVDSIVLLNVATKVCDKKLIEVLHFNHNSRKNCVQDFKFVENLCKEYKVKFHGEILPVIKKSDQENQWRKLRQKISRDLAEEIGAMRILTAHHATDLVETMIFRLTKGCGPSGLSPFELGKKPFWQVPKSNLINYAKSNNLEWNEDESNKKSIHSRNLIRHKVLPELRKITPSLEKVFVRESQIFAGITEYLNQEVREKSAKKEIPLSEFLKLPFILQAELLREISREIPSMSEIEDCLKWLKKDPPGGSVKSIGGTQLKLVKGVIIW